ncbi:MAG: hypothetical protein ACYC9L_02880 [Sulfuricaulis sp.]
MTLAIAKPGPIARCRLLAQRRRAKKHFLTARGVRISEYTRYNISALRKTVRDYHPPAVAKGGARG